MNVMHRVVVLGAGYAGLNAVVRLSKEVDPETVSITLVNASPDFIERPRLHQVATGQDVAVHPLKPILAGRNVELLVGYARSIDLDAKTVTVGSADSVTDLEYDTLVYALGSRIATSAVPGIGEHAHVLGDVEASTRIRAGLLPGATVVICGGGLTGIEAATEFAEAHPEVKVHLVSRGEPGAWLSPGARRHVEAAFTRLGVDVTSGVSIEAIEDGAVVLADGARIGFDTCVWAGGFEVPELAAEAGLQVDARGRAVVDDRLRSVSHPEVYVVGDAAALAGEWGESLAYGCRVGGFMGPYVADGIAAKLAGREAAAFKFRYIHQCVSLGRKDAVIQFVHAGDETPRNAVLRGKVAVWYKDLVLGSAVWLFSNPGPYLPRRKVRVGV